ncbi:MAG TPA: GNAT family N-acetyltransferase, partial [Candidatus Limnocylindria bacterium]|nr:GNAT family N-acetyltransferase [Candidatus Limnocylindria bacterium]
GLIAFDGRQPVGWVSVGPRVEFGRILRSPVTRLSPEERSDPSVWSVVCFFIPRTNRGRGIGRFLLDAAVDHARRSGASRVEGYPVDTAGRRVASASVFIGTRDLFERAGFERLAEHWKGRPIMTRVLEQGVR